MIKKRFLSLIIVLVCFQCTKLIISYFWNSNAPNGAYVLDNKKNDDKNLDNIVTNSNNGDLLNLTLEYIDKNFTLIVSVLLSVFVANAFAFFWLIGLLKKDEILAVRAMRLPVSRETLFSFIVSDVEKYPSWRTCIKSVSIDKNMQNPPDNASPDNTCWSYRQTNNLEFLVENTENESPKCHVRVVRCVYTYLPTFLSWIHTIPYSKYVMEFTESESHKGHTNLFITRIYKCSSPILRFFTVIRHPSHDLEVYMKDIATKFGVENPKIISPINGKLELLDD